MITAKGTATRQRIIDGAAAEIRAHGANRQQGVHCPLGTLITELGRYSPAARAVTGRLIERWQGDLIAHRTTDLPVHHRESRGAAGTAP